MQLSTPHEDYLERILELVQEKGYARVSDIADKLSVTPASVTHMVKKLETMGFLKREPYRGFSLNNKGIKVAEAVHHRHTVLRQFFSILDLDAVTTETDIEGLEHHLSPKTVQAIEKLILKLQQA